MISSIFDILSTDVGVSVTKFLGVAECKSFRKMFKTGLSNAKVWHLVDANDKILGSLAQRISVALRGKYKPHFNQSVDTGDYVVVINSNKVHLTGKKFHQKKYHWHTGWPDGLKSITYDKLLEKNPSEPLRKAVYGMLPKTPLRKVFMSRLYVFPDEIHPYSQNILKCYDGIDTTESDITECIKQDEKIQS